MHSEARPSRDETLMGVAAVFAQRSTCARLHVGSVFSRDGRILVTGYNGAPKGLPHCNHDCNCHPTKLDMGIGGAPEHLTNCASLLPCTAAEHAERNAIAWAARNGVALEGCEVHVTHMPCLPCAMALINAGVSKVVYMHAYRITDGVELLEQAGVQVVDYPVGK